MIESSISREIVKIPEGVDISITERVVSVRGPLGKLERDFYHMPIALRQEDDEVIIEAHWPNKKTRATVGSVRSHIKNMIIGVTKGFTYKLKVVYAHFPMTVKIKGQELIVENFGGERQARSVTFPRTIKVTLEGDDILIKGMDLEEVSQTAANVEQKTKIRKKDPRVFLDGIYVYEKGVS